jgi:hypothetical protein
MVIASDWSLAVHELLDGRPLFFNSNSGIKIESRHVGSMHIVGGMHLRWLLAV